MAPPHALQTLVARYDHAVFEPVGGQARVRLEIGEEEAWDAILGQNGTRLVARNGGADATLAADRQTWQAIARDVRGGMRAYLKGRLSIRRNLHLGVGFLAATALGGNAWEKAGRIWFITLTTRLDENSDFQAAANATVEVSGELFGAGGAEEQAVRAAWRQVVITPA